MAQQTTTDCLVIIPTYNERENAAAIIDAVIALPVEMNVLIVDDGSPDGTANIVREKIAQYPDRVYLLERSGKQGLGTAYLTGFKWALQRGYEYIFEMDADFSHNPKDLVALYNKCSQEGADVAIGSRYITGVNVVNWPMSRVLMSYCASMYVRFILDIPVHDTTAGFVCYRSRVLRHLDLDSVRFKGYAFQIEMKYSAYKSGFTLKEVPIVFVNRVLGESKMNTGIFSEAMFGVLQLRLDTMRHKFKPIAR